MNSKISSSSGNFFTSLFLLAIRLWWGWLFFREGIFKFTDMPETIGFFNSLGLSSAIAYLVAIGEVVFGVFMFFGFITRLAALGTVVITLGAYLIAERPEFFSFFSSPPMFFAAAPFSFLFASLVILFFGAGMFSIDAMVLSHMRNKVERENHDDDRNNDKKD